MRKKWIQGCAALAVSLFAVFGVPDIVEAGVPETALEGFTLKISVSAE